MGTEKAPEMPCTLVTVFVYAKTDGLVVENVIMLFCILGVAVPLLNGGRY